MSDDRRGDRDGVGAREPLHPAAAGQDHQNRRRGRDVHRARGRAEPRVQRGQPFRQRALGRKPLEQVLGVAQRGVRRRHEHQHGRGDEADGQQAAQPAGAGQVLRETGQRRAHPGALLAAGTRSANRNVVSVVTNSANTSVSSAVRHSACTRGGSQLVGGLGQRFAAADRGSARQKPDQAGERRCRDTSAAR